MKVEIYRCDGCKAEAGDVSKWWFLIENDGFCVFRKGHAHAGQGPFTQSHFCGQGCLIKELSQRMERA